MAARAELAAPAPALPVHFLPCRLAARGPAPVSGYFRPREGEHGGLWASLRGRRLGGLELPLPPGYRGLVLGEGPGGSECRQLRVTGTFGAVTAWGADAAPPPGSGLGGALVWAPLAQAIHAPVSDNEEAEP